MRPIPARRGSNTISGIDSPQAPLYIVPMLQKAANTPWVTPELDPRALSALGQSQAMPDWVARFLFRRGVQAPEEAVEFLSPGLKQLPSYAGLKGLEQAAEVLIPAIRSGETIGVAGDYDADGVTGTSLLVEFFRQCGAKVVWNIPHRLHDGYGFSPGAARKLSQAGAKIIVTVDCGISDQEGVREALALGMKVVVTDHHQLPPGECVPAQAVINPQQSDCALSSRLAGVGVAFYVAAGLRAALRGEGHFNGHRAEPNLLQSLDFVALGTLADVVPLKGVNRILVSEGLKVLNRLSRPGFAALAKVAGLKVPFDARDAAFSLAPRINAAGRLDSASLAVELLTCDQPGKALEIAKALDETNRMRKEIEQEVFRQAVKTIEDSPELRDNPFPVLAEKYWHRGVLGIVASRLVELLGRPVMLFALENGTAHGSGRSVKGFHLQKALAQNREMFISYGGHAMAAAATLPTKLLPDLTQRLSDLAGEKADEFSGEEPIEIDGELPLSLVGPATMKWLDRLGPFGQGNPEPTLVTRSARVENSRIVGDNHLKLDLSQGGARAQAIGFNLGHLRPETGQLIDLAHSPRISNFRGRHLELGIFDLRPVNTG